MAEIKKFIADDEHPLSFLREFTQARIAISSAGNGIPTKNALEFKLAHAHARDAVYSVMDTERLYDELIGFNLPVLPLHSQATTREQYLQRPDLGRLPDETSMNRLADQVQNNGIVFIVADGLSAAAVNENAVPLLQVVIPQLIAAKHKVGHICLVEQGRVAIADHIGAELGASLSVILIGERPGLSAADSMSAYLTFNPKPGLKDDARNCISNIRTQGLPIAAAATKLFYLIQEAFSLKLSGVGLKDNEQLLG
ncbi:MAG: ethanolamine ammonia-lyase subunit EutC [Sphingobacteriales bacterium]|nr:MAG: ethanolamine ammonia-lyase subunit EutC [Sphingobacteriales bacterium]